MPETQNPSISDGLTQSANTLKHRVLIVAKNPSKPTVFISHISDEKDVAIALKVLVEKAFLGLIRVFVSSDPTSLRLGEKWQDAIAEALGHCAVEIIIASPTSVKRPWINFEGGAGWIRNIPVIPLCHSGMTPGKLPAPLSTLQAACATNIDELRNVFPILADAIGAQLPIIDYTGFIKHVVDFEETDALASPMDKETLLALTDTAGTHHSAKLSLRRDGALGKWVGVANQDAGPDGNPIQIPMTFELCAKGSGIIGTGTVHVRTDTIDSQFQLRLTARLLSESLIKFDYTAADPSINHHGGGMMELSPDTRRIVSKYAGYSVLLGKLVSGTINFTKES